MVTLFNNFPQAFHISNNLWMVLTIRDMVFHIKCVDRVRVVLKELHIKPPYGLVHLNDLCVASNELLLHYLLSFK